MRLNWLCHKSSPRQSRPDDTKSRSLKAQLRAPLDLKRESDKGRIFELVLDSTLQTLSLHCFETGRDDGRRLSSKTHSVTAHSWRPIWFFDGLMSSLGLKDSGGYIRCPVLYCLEVIQLGDNWSLCHTSILSDISRIAWFLAYNNICNFIFQNLSNNMIDGFTFNTTIELLRVIQLPRSLTMIRSVSVATLRLHTLGDSLWFQVDIHGFETFFCSPKSD